MGQSVELREVIQGHIFYKYENEENYLTNLISFILLGLKKQHRVLVVESAKNLPKIKERMKTLVSVEKMTEIHLVNNFDFYLSNGDFQTQTIVEHFSHYTSLADKELKPAWTWAHVEWSSQEPNCNLIQKFECKANEVIQNEQRLSVCAYPSDRLSAQLHLILEKNHDHVINDNSEYFVL